MASLSQQEIIYLISLGSLGMLMTIGGLAFFFVVYQRRMLLFKESKKRDDEEHAQKMIELQLESQEFERKRIAADLHDSVGSLLWGAKLTAAYIERTGELQQEQKDSHKELMEILDQSIHVVKRISWELTPEGFHYSGLSLSISSLCARFNGHGLKVIFIEEGSTVLWNDERALSSFRIVQELVSNGVKHAAASMLIVRLFWSETELMVEVSDNGKGFELGETRNGIGWWNINHRAKQLSATIDIGEPPTTGGSIINLKIPLPNDSK